MVIHGVTDGACGGPSFWPCFCSCPRFSPIFQSFPERDTGGAAPAANSPALSGAPLALLQLDRGALGAERGRKHWHTAAGTEGGDAGDEDELLQNLVYRLTASNAATTTIPSAMAVTAGALAAAVMVVVGPAGAEAAAALAARPLAVQAATIRVRSFFPSMAARHLAPARKTRTAAIRLSCHPPCRPPCRASRRCPSLRPGLSLSWASDLSARFCAAPATPSW